MSIELLKQRHLVEPLIAPDLVIISEADAQRAASTYVATQLDPTYQVVSGSRCYSTPLQRQVWRFFIRSAEGPVGMIRVDAQSGKVIFLTDDEMRSVYEKATILKSRQRGDLPVGENGYVLREHARRRANGYLNMEINLFFCAVDGAFVEQDRPVWRFPIQFRLPKSGVLGTVGEIEIDAQSGNPIFLTNEQISCLRVRADAIMEFRTQTTTA